MFPDESTTGSVSFDLKCLSDTFTCSLKESRSQNVLIFRIKKCQVVDF